MKQYVLRFYEIDKESLPYVGGKGANLGEMTKAGFPVPQGFCVTTLAYKALIQNSEEMKSLFKQLEGIKQDDLRQIQQLGQQIREHLSTLAMPQEIENDILKAWEENGSEKAYAVRSSATAEDLPTASFAGQQDTYLNIIGRQQLLKAIQNCWASLFTDRAIAYRAKNNFDHRTVFLSVVVQEMVFPEVSGILFTADPITGRRKTVSIDASYGLGEALVSGLVTADLYQVRSGKIIHKKISQKKLAIYGLPQGGTETKDLPAEKQELQALSDESILQLAALGQHIEDHYGTEQDIEWGFAGGRFYILQSRPITSLYPIPKAKDDPFKVYVSFGHIQMMTEAMKPLSISLLSRLPNFLSGDPMDNSKSFIYSAGGRAFADVTGALLLPPSRKMLLKVSGGMDAFMSAALAEVLKREELIKLHPNKKAVLGFARKMLPILLPVFAKIFANLYIHDPSQARSKVESIMKEIYRTQEQSLQQHKGAPRIRVIMENTARMLPEVLAKIAPYLAAGVLASGTLIKKLKEQAGEKQAALLLSRLNKSLPGNVTTELGLELGDLSDWLRPYPAVIAYLQNAKKETFYEGLQNVEGGTEFNKELQAFLRKYGMRCSGEIDITKTRWNEDPTQLIPSILSNLNTMEAGEHRAKYRQGQIEAEQAEKEILALFGPFKRRRIARLLKRYRNLMGLREHHKFAVIQILDLYKHIILEEAGTLTQKGVLKQPQEIYDLTFEELLALLENRYEGNVRELIEERVKQYEWNQRLSVPRVMTSEGEQISGKTKDTQAPTGALVGTPVSAGTIEGIARVILRLEEAELNPGEILVAPYTDPGWTPLFTSAIGLVTEIGGMMTHGSVVAREYGIPAVVGIDKATEIIKDGDRIRVNGTEGFVEILKG